ncbi:MAG TPA: endonuclease III [Firmicutes bacterium]|nr:endonuclease III [Bacillota bacterium]
MDNRAKEIFSLLEKNYPRARTRLNFNNPFQLLVACVLSAQTTDEQVNKVTGELFSKVEGPRDMARLQPAQLEPYLKGCGLHRQKSRYLIKTCQIIMEEFEGEIPRRFEDLVTLPGVGRKTANVIISTAFGVPALAVDTHVYRVSRRLGLAISRTAAGVEQELRQKLPPEKWAGAHHRLIAHGRKVCAARNPKCQQCFLNYCCPFDCLHPD